MIKNITRDAFKAYCAKTGFDAHQHSEDAKHAAYHAFKYATASAEAKYLPVIRIMDEALADLGACNDRECTNENCNHARSLAAPLLEG